MSGKNTTTAIVRKADLPDGSGLEQVMESAKRYGNVFPVDFPKEESFVIVAQSNLFDLFTIDTGLWKAFGNVELIEIKEEDLSDLFQNEINA